MEHIPNSIQSDRIRGGEEEREQHPKFGLGNGHRVTFSAGQNYGSRRESPGK